jgi:hypothetical protein
VIPYSSDLFSHRRNPNLSPDLEQTTFTPASPEPSS